MASLSQRVVDETACLRAIVCITVSHEVSAFGQLPEDSPPDALLLPAGESLVDGIPVAKTGREVAPRCARPSDVQHDLDELATVDRTTARIALFALTLAGDQAIRRRFAHHVIEHLGVGLEG